MNIALIGAQRTFNYGDLLLALIYARWVRDVLPNARLSLPYASPEIAASLGFPTPDYAQGIRKADKVLFLGGGYFGEAQGPTWRDHAVRFHRYMYPGMLARAMGKDMAVIGVGFGPLSHYLLRRSATSILNSSRVVALRDVESKELAEKYGVKPGRIQVTADAALTLQWSDLGQEAVAAANKLLENTSSNTRIGVHLSNSPDGSPAYAAAFDDLYKHMERHPDHHVYILCDQKDSSGQAKSRNELQENLGPRATYLDYQEPYVLSALFGLLDVVLTDKLHVGIVARALGTPSVSVAKHQKTPRLYRQLAASEDCIAIEDIQAGFVLASLSRLLVDGRFEIPGPLIESANGNKRLVREFLES